MLALIKAGFEAMRIGNEVRKPEVYKSVQQLGNYLAGLVLLAYGTARALNVPLPFEIDAEGALVIGGILATIWNVVLSYATTKKIGLLPAQPSASLKDGPANPDDPYIG